MDKNVERDERILAHIGLYRITFRAVLSSLFFGGRTPGNVIQRMLAEGRIQARSGLPQHLRYYQLTAREADARGLPVARSRPPKPQALESHLAILWHCCMTPGIRDRRRLEPAEMVKLFGDRFPSGVHLMQAGPRPFVMRVHVVGTGARSRNVLRALRGRIERYGGHTHVGPWIQNRQYAFLLLAEAPAHRARLKELMHRHAKRLRAQVEVEFGPSSRSVGAAFRRGQR